MTPTAGLDKAFEGATLAIPGPVLVRTIRVWFPTGNDFNKIYAKKQEATGTNISLVGTAWGDPTISIIKEPILLSPAAPRIQVYVNVQTSGEFILEIEYEVLKK